MGRGAGRLHPLHVGDQSHLLRTPLATLEEGWAEAGFVRIHRSLLVNLAHIDEVRMDAGRCTVLVGDDVLGVSRRIRESFVTCWCGPRSRERDD
jgi:DNA-binding LytR/AlgR family response regulator